MFYYRLKFENHEFRKNSPSNLTMSVQSNPDFHKIWKFNPFDGAKRSTELTPKSPPFKAGMENAAQGQL